MISNFIASETKYDVKWTLWLSQRKGFLCWQMSSTKSWLRCVVNDWVCARFWLFEMSQWTQFNWYRMSKPNTRLSSFFPNKTIWIVVGLPCKFWTVGLISVWMYHLVRTYEWVDASLFFLSSKRKLTNIHSVYCLEWTWLVKEDTSECMGLYFEIWGHSPHYLFHFRVFYWSWLVCLIDYTVANNSNELHLSPLL